MFDYDALILIELKNETENDARKTPISSGYRGQFHITDNYITSGQIELIDSNTIEPGETGMAFTKFVSPQHYQKSLWINKRLEISEGNKIVGFATIKEIYNPLLNKENNLPIIDIEKVLDKELKSIKSIDNFHGITIENLNIHLVRPELIIVNVYSYDLPDEENEGPFIMWLVLTEYINNKKKGYQIAFCIENTKWYLIEYNENKYYYVTRQDSLIDAIEGM